MSRTELRRIWNAIEQGHVQVSQHASDELAEDDLDLDDMVAAIKGGELIRIDHGDPRGVRYTLAGLAADKRRRVGVIGRFKATGDFLIITAFAAREVE